MSVLCALALHDVRAWLRSPAMLGLSLLPAVGMGLLVALLSISIGRQPVALVQEGTGPLAEHMAHLLDADDEAYVVERLDRASAARALESLRVAYLFFLGGGFATVAFLPPWLEGVSRFVPTSHAISALRQILFYPDLDGVLGNLLTVAAAALVCVAAGVVALRRSWGNRA